MANARQGSLQAQLYELMVAFSNAKLSMAVTGSTKGEENLCRQEAATGSKAWKTRK